ncbi:MAG: tRNA modification GTPase, partial [Anaerolineae bacterium]
GEFPLRAFVNGRIDLTQAEAVRDLIAAGSAAAARQAVAQLEGRLGSRVRLARTALLRALAGIEASIDFDDEDAPPPSVQPLLLPVRAQLQDLVAGATAGIIRREGLRVAIIGRPNVGKSSLMNALLRADRSIVTAVPGTTRDTVEESASIGGVALVFVDTAGLSPASDDPVERLGMERTQRAVRQADVTLLVLDASATPDSEDVAAARLASEAPQVLTVWNKCDLATPDSPSPLDRGGQVRVSALTGQGLGELEAALLQGVLGQGAGDAGGDITSERQRNAVERALDSLQRAVEAGEAHVPADLIAIDIREAIAALGEVTGETVDEDLLAMVFASFCVGK